jgi:uncharacterized protein
MWRIRQPPAIATALAIGLTVLIALGGAALGKPSLPALTGRVVDLANLLPPSEEAEIEAISKAHEATSTDQIVVVTVPSLQGYPIEEFGIELARAWAIGQQGKDNGVLLIVAPNEREVRIEVGRRLEPLLTDGITRLIIENRILPQFRRGDFAGGIVSGVTDIRDVLAGDAEEVEKRAGGARAPETDWAALVFVAIWIIVVLIIVWRSHRAARQGVRSGRRQRRGSDWVILPGGSGGSGGWSGGRGGGFSGGGGGFGGGGASGRW